MKNENKKKSDEKQDLLKIDAETGLLSHPNTLESVSPNSGILFPNLFVDSSERITLYFGVKCEKFHDRSLMLLHQFVRNVSTVKELSSKVFPKGAWKCASWQPLISSQRLYKVL